TKDKRTYEIMRPEDVRVAESKSVLSARSGRHAFRQRLKELGYELDDDAFKLAWDAFLQLADKKKEVTDRDLQTLVADEVRSVPERFTLELVQVSCGTNARPSATVRLRDAERDALLEDAAVGGGPVAGGGAPGRPRPPPRGAPRRRCRSRGRRRRPAGARRGRSPLRLQHQPRRVSDRWRRHRRARVGAAGWRGRSLPRSRRGAARRG